MNKVVIINDTDCEREVEQFLKRHRNNIVLNAETTATISDISRIISNLKTIAGYSDRIAINAANTVNILKIKDIMHCESQRSYTQVHLTNGTSLTVTRTLRQFEEDLMEYRFVRIHQSHLVNLNYVVKYLKSKAGCVVLENGTKLPVATRKREQLFKELEVL